MKELGVKPKIERDPDGGVCIEFKSSDGKTVSPVEIHLSQDAITTSSAEGWRGSTMKGTFWEDIEIGDSGWTLQQFCRSYHQFEIGVEADAFFTTLAEWLPGHGVIHLDRSKDGFTMNEDFAAAFEIIKTVLPEEEKIAVNCERGPASDAYIFTYPNDCEWRVDFVGRSAAVTANGEEVTLVDTTELEQIVPAIRSHLAKKSARRDPGI
jgi:hypothetical protein